MIGCQSELDSLRKRMLRARQTIARLSAAGVEAREYITIAGDDEERMNNAVIALRVLKERYAESLAIYCGRRGLRLPREVEVEAQRIAA